MEKMTAQGLLAVLVDVLPEDEEDVLRWYDEEHLIERASIKGFVNARRYISISGIPRFLALYDTENVGVLHSDAYLEMLRKNPTEWTRRAVRKFVSPTRNEYELAGAWGENPGALAPFILMTRFNIDEPGEAKFIAEYDGRYLPELAQVPGVGGIKRYKAAEGQPRYLTLVELASEDVTRTSAWQEVTESDAGRKMDSSMSEPAVNLGRLVNSVYSPS